MNRGRYAIYFAPAKGSAWWEFGAHWLGRDDTTLEPLRQPVVRGFSGAEFAAFTAEPRRYGFHATLKAPMRLVATAGERDLLGCVDALAAQSRAVPIAAPKPVLLDDGFVALVPARPIAEIDALAARCVTDLDTLRAPLEQADIARRRPERLDERLRELLERYGYPHVLEHFRFHMTLTGPVPVAAAARVVEHVTPVVARLAEASPLVLDRLCVFHEREPGATFRRIHDAELRA